MVVKGRVQCGVCSQGPAGLCSRYSSCYPSAYVRFSSPSATATTALPPFRPDACPPRSRTSSTCFLSALPSLRTCVSGTQRTALGRLM